MTTAPSSSSCSVERRIDAGHPCFAGHFPGRPVLPGALLLAEVVEAAEAAFAPAPAGAACEVRSLKFLRPLGPGDAIRIELRRDGARVRFEVHGPGGVAASGQLAWGAP